MTPGYDPTAFADLAELLRRKQLGQSMPNVTQTQPQTQPPVQPQTPVKPLPQTEVQPPQQAATAQPPVAQQPTPAQQPAYDPTKLQANMDDITQLRKQMQSLDTAGLAAAGKKLEDVPAFPTRDQFHKNKLLSILMAPTTAMQYISDPKGAMRTYNYGTRPGLAQAEEDWKRDYDQRQRVFEAKSKVISEQARIFNEQLSGAEHGVNAQIAVDNFKHATSQWPVEDQIRVNQLAISNFNAKNLGSPQVEKEPFQVHTPDGASFVAQMRTHPDGTVDFIRPGEKEPIPSKGLMYERLPANRVLTNDEKVWNQLYEEWRRDPKNAEYAQKYPGSVPGKVALEFNEKVAQSKENVKYQNAVLLLQKREAARVAEESRKFTHQEFMQAKNKRLNQFESERKGMIQQFEALRNTASTLNLTNKAGAASVMAIIDQVMTGASKTNSRFNSKEFDRIADSAGGWAAIRASVDKWLSGGPGVSPKVIEALKLLTQTTQKELQRQLQINGKYHGLAEGSAEQDDLTSIMRNYDREFLDMDNWEKGLREGVPDNAGLKEALKGRHLIP